MGFTCLDLFWSRWHFLNSLPQDFKWNQDSKCTVLVRCYQLLWKTKPFSPNKHLHWHTVMLLWIGGKEWSHSLLTPISPLLCFSNSSSMWELAWGMFSGHAWTPAPKPSLWSKRRGRELIGDLCVMETAREWKCFLCYLGLLTCCRFPANTYDFSYHLNTISKEIIAR